MAESNLKELLGLVEDTAEYASYLRELGVEGTLEQPGAGQSPAASAHGRTARPVSEAPPAPENIAALRRNAVAAERAARQSSAETASPLARAAQDLTEGSAAPNGSEQTEMAKKKKYPDAEPPPPQETLFGTITPQDEESLPRSSETLEDIWNDIGECMRCPLCQSRTRVVNSEGNPKARLMFIGEAPGADEDATGRPFVGRAGQLLNKIIEAIGLKRDDIMIGNVNRCRPPQNRTPTSSEAATCKPFLLREIAIIRPDVIVVLGNTAMKNLLDTKEGITRLRGQFQDYRGIKVMPTFHPAYLLRDPSKKREAWEDMKKVRDYLNTVTSEK
ncbi:MAG TPA: uracil-DNA glycosylase family protein [Pyrinomonadaceae bacterium]|jgi:DNA polymerase|nr:uracil-DNA glycosylase family protein [Pyrinomonadaceae bacterium]